MALVARREEKLEDLAVKIRAAGDGARTVVCDLTEEGASERVFDAAATSI